MSWSLRSILIIASLATSVYVIRKIRKSQMKIESSIYWFFFSIMIMIFSFFPKVAYIAADLMGIESPANFIYLLMIFLLLVKVFSLSIKNSQLEYKLSVFAEEFAIYRNEMSDERDAKRGIEENEKSVCSGDDLQ